MQDDLINRTVLQKRLTKDGFLTSVATDGQNCLDIFIKAKDFNCVLMDIQ